MRHLQPCGVLDRCDDGLHLQVVLQAVDALLPPDAALLVPAEGNPGVKDVEAVHPDGTDPESACQGVGRVQALGEHTGSQSILARICPLDNLIQISVEAGQKKSYNPIYCCFRFLCNC